MTQMHTPPTEAAWSARRALPPLPALRCFVVAAQTGSFTRAAEALCVTQGAVSRQVLQLEAFYGQPLFVRQARGLALTEAGRMLEQTARVAFEQISYTSRVLNRQRASQQLRFMMPTCTMLWAMPRLMRFNDQHPALRVAVTTTLRHAMDEELFDIGIVYARLDEPHPHQQLLLAERLTPVCSSRALLGPKGLRQPQDLAHCTLLHARPDHEDWRLWLAAHHLPQVDYLGGLDFETLDMSNNAAAEGYGVALGDRVMARSAIEAGRLCAPFALDVATGYGFFLRWHEVHRQRPEIALLQTTLMQDIDSHLVAPRQAA